MRILVLSQHYWPESFRINSVVESLQLEGCLVSVLTGQPNYPDGAIYRGYRATALGSESHAAGYPVYRVPLAPRGKGSAWRLTANYLSFVASASLLGPWLLRGRRFDIILVYGTSPILQAMAGVVLKRIKGAALITWVQDLWPQSLEVTGYVRNKRVLAMVAYVVRWIYRNNDLLLVQSLAFVRPVRAMAETTPVEYHPNPGETIPEPSTSCGAPALILGQGFNVVFAGNFGTVQALDTLLSAAKLLQHHTDVRLVLIGSGGRTDWLRREIVVRRLDNVHMPGRFAPEVMPEILKQASALLVSLAKDPILSQTVPSKIQSYLSAGRPVIASLDGEGARVVSESGAGLTCAAEDSEALARAVLKLRAATPADLQRMGEAGRSYYEHHFEPRMLARRLTSRFSDLLGGKKMSSPTD